MIVSILTPLTNILSLCYADRIHSWAKAHASTPNNSQGQNQSNTQSSEDASAQDAQVKEGIRDPASPESEKDANQTTERPLFVRMKDGIVRFTGHTKRALCHSWVNVLLVFVPVGIAVQAAGLNPGLVFAMNAIAIIPLAGLLSHATECVASRLGDTVGALINVTFGNAVELIILYVPNPTHSPLTVANVSVACKLLLIRVCAHTNTNHSGFVQYCPSQGESIGSATDLRIALTLSRMRFGSSKHPCWDPS